MKHLVALSQLHERPGLVAFSQSSAGRFLLWLTATALLIWNEASMLMVPALGAVTIWPAQRRSLLALAALGMMLRWIGTTVWPGSFAGGALDLGAQDLFRAGCLLAVGVTVLYAFYRLLLAFKQWPKLLQRSPVLWIHAGVWTALGLSTQSALGFLSAGTFLTWRLSYMARLAVRGRFEDSRFRDHLMYLVPVYGGTTTPYGKGLDFLSRHEAGDSESFARSQLAGLKLLWLAMLWRVVHDLLDALVFGHPWAWAPDLPSLAWRDLDDWLGSGLVPSAGQAWATLYLELILACLNIAAFGHVIVGCLRLLGFNVFRNTYKPLLSETVLEFWNRYYYYFKELLVDFFFYPAYLRLTGLNPRLRMLAAVFAAAFAGNMYFHFVIQPQAILQLDPAAFWSTWNSRMVYCALLSLGIWVSMLRQTASRRRRGTTGGWLRWRRIAGVWTFYSVIQIWNVSGPNSSAKAGLDYFMALLGMALSGLD